MGRMQGVGRGEGERSAQGRTGIGRGGEEVRDGRAVHVKQFLLFFLRSFSLATGTAASPRVPTPIMDASDPAVVAYAHPWVSTIMLTFKVRLGARTRAPVEQKKRAHGQQAATAPRPSSVAFACA